MSTSRRDATGRARRSMLAGEQLCLAFPNSWGGRRKGAGAGAQGAFGTREGGAPGASDASGKGAGSHHHASGDSFFALAVPVSHGRGSDRRYESAAWSAISDRSIFGARHPHPSPAPWSCTTHPRSQHLLAPHGMAPTRTNLNQRNAAPLNANRQRFQSTQLVAIVLSWRQRGRRSQARCMRLPDRIRLGAMMPCAK